jgi:hypothetical protein
MRYCIFCEGRATSKEDAWPMWLTRRLGATEAGIVEAQRGKQKPNTWIAGKAGLKVRFVCASCNNGWLSRLENRVKPIIEGLFDEESVALGFSDQNTLAAWGVKNAMVHEALRLGTPWFFMNSERNAMRDSLQLPPLTSIWIAKCIEHNGVYCKASDLSGVSDVSKDLVKVYVTTMGFGPLAIQVVCRKFLNSIPTIMEVTTDMQLGPWDQVTLQIWPIHVKQIIWPASMGLIGEHGLDKFSERWSPVQS